MKSCQAIGSQADLRRPCRRDQRPEVPIVRYLDKLVDELAKGKAMGEDFAEMTTTVATGMVN